MIPAANNNPTSRQMKPAAFGSSTNAPRWLSELQGRQLQIIAKVLSVALIAMGALHYFQGRPVTGTLLTTLGVTAGTILILAQKSKINFRVIHFLMAIVLLVLFLVSAISGKDTPASAMLFGLPAFLFAAVGERRAMAVWSATGLGALALLYKWPTFGIPLPQEMPNNFTLIYFYVAAILLVIVSLIGLMLVTLQRGLLEELTLANKNMTEAMDAAVKANASKQQFLARMSHELRTPLNAILGFCQILAQDRNDSLSRNQSNNIQHIETSGAKLLELVDEILEIAEHDGTGYFTSVAIPLKPHVDAAIRALQSTADQKSIKLLAKPMANIFIQGDPKQLRRIIDQLLSNAIAFNKHNGTVTIDAIADEQSVAISIEDTGIGMSETQISEAFSPFGNHGLDGGPSHGAGVGLALAKKIVDQMQGNIFVTSEPGKGSRFVVRLPNGGNSEGGTEIVAANPVESGATTADEVTDGIRRVFYVEDAPLNVLLMEALFAELPQFKLHIASTEADALANAAAIKPWLMLLDLNLPDMHGIDLLAKIRTNTLLTNVDAIAVSADATKDTIDRALSSGFDAYWVKPVNLDTIRNALLRRIESEK